MHNIKIPSWQLIELILVKVIILKRLSVLSVTANKYSRTQTLNFHKTTKMVINLGHSKVGYHGDSKKWGLTKIKKYH